MEKAEYLTTEQLAARWNMSADTLRNWRSKNIGPAYVRIGFGKTQIHYELAEIKAYEAAHFTKAVSASR